MNFDVPAEKRTAIVREFGRAGQDWVDQFPDLLAACVGRWKLTLNEMVPGGLPANMIFLGKNDTGRAIALKVGCPHPELFTEVIALRQYAGRHAVRLIDASEALGAILMERVIPGTQFRHFANGIERSRMSLDLFSDISLAADEVPGLPTFEDWVTHAFSRFRSGTAPDPEFLGFVERAERCFEEIRARYEARYMIHGDLHHENILLDDRRGWVAIDPKGVIAPAILEPGRFLHNFIADEIPGIDSLTEATASQIEDVLDVRFATFSQLLGVPADELAKVAWIDLILGSCWTLNDGGDATDGFCIARALEPRVDKGFR